MNDSKKSLPRPKSYSGTYDLREGYSPKPYKGPKTAPKMSALSAKKNPKKATG